MTYRDGVLAHLEARWGKPARVQRGPRGVADREPVEVAVFERDLWTYATLDMSNGISPAIEVFLLSKVDSPMHVETLAMIADYHRTGARLGLGHTVNLGRPWLPQSSCDHALLSLPYLDGPDVEVCEVPDAQCLWLIPITKAERDYKAAHGLEALEQLFDGGALDYANSLRTSLTPR